MVIHTKQKTKLHLKARVEAKIKGRNVLTVCRGPKISAGMATVKKLSVSKNRRNAVTVKMRVGSNSIKINKKQYDGKFTNTAKHRQASHLQEGTKQSAEQVVSRYRQYQKSKQDREGAIGKKSEYVKMAGAIGTKAALDQIEGGDEVYDAYMIMNQIPKPVGIAYNAGKRLYRNHTAKGADKRMKKKILEKEFKKREEKPHFSKGTEETVKERAKKQSQGTFRNQINKKVKKKTVKIAKDMVKTTARTARGTAGTVATGGAGAIAAVAAGEVNRIAMDRKDIKSSTKTRMIQLFVAKLRQEENQNNIGKAFKDIILMRSALITKYLIRNVGGLLLALFAITALIAIPIIAIIATSIILHLPFSFHPFLLVKPPTKYFRLMCRNLTVKWMQK